MTVLNEEARDLFAGPNIAHIATLLPDGGPHSVPVMIDLEGEYLAFFTSPHSRKGRNLQADDRIAVSVTDRENLVRGALVRGRVVQRVGGDAGWEIAIASSPSTPAAHTLGARTARPSSWNRRT